MNNHTLIKNKCTYVYIQQKKKENKIECLKKNEGVDLTHPCCNSQNVGGGQVWNCAGVLVLVVYVHS